jgi:hypothetical protein
VTTLRSDGAPEARAYVKIDVPASSREPTLEMERVRVLDPRHTPTLHLETQQASGPRNPDQRALPEPDELRVELPDGRPLTEPQRVIVPPELVARWLAEAEEKRGA